MQVNSCRYRHRPHSRRFAKTFTLLALSGVALVPPFARAHAQSPAARLKPTELQAALAKPMKNRDAEGVVAGLHGMATVKGVDKLPDGMPPRVETGPGTMTVAWAIEAAGLAPGTPVAVTTDDPNLLSVALHRVGTSDVYAAAVPTANGLAGHWAYHVGDRTMATGQVEEYPTNPEEVAQASVPKGKLTEMPAWRSQIFAGTSRHWWVYVPAQYAADKPAAVMVCQDGGGPKNWLPTVLDNMTAKGEVPPTVAIFIDPGTFDDGKSDRSVEYDTVSDKYSQMLLQEILPEVEKTAKLSADPSQRVIYGVSSGGICAFTVAWEHPEAFGKVDTCVGSFTNLQGGPTGVAGGNTYPAIIRHYAGWNHDGKPKPIKMYQTDGANDIDNAAGSWPLSNQQIAKALDYGGYTHRFVFGNGFHGDRFGRYKMPDALRYLWGSDK